MFKKILVPLELDDAEEAEFLFSAAVELATPMNAALVVMTVVPDFPTPLVASFFPDDFEQQSTEAARQALDTFVKAHAEAGMVSKQLIGHGSVYKEIMRAAEAEACDAIVIGQGDAEAGDFLIGHNAARVMRHTKCSVLLIRKTT